MSRATTFTLLSLSEYARYLHLNPLQFAGGVSALVPGNACGDVWRQWTWQDDGKISREYAAQLIADAENDIAKELGYWPAPRWIEDERHSYPGLYDRSLTGYGQDLKGRYRSLPLNYGHVLYGGQRATELLDDDPVGYIPRDFDNDGFNEAAEFTITVSSTMNPCEVKLYFKEYAALDAENCRTDPSSTGADFKWEIRPIRTSLSGTTLTILVDKWELFKPQLQEGLAVNDIDADDGDSYVDAVLVYREYNDPSQPVQFLWGNDIYCNPSTESPCAWVTQDGCLQPSDKRLGLATPIPATYNETTGVFTESAWSQGYEPDGVRLWYRAGATESTSSCPVLDRFWGSTIAMLATARLDFPLCSCEEMAERVSSKWTTDLAEINQNRTFQNPASVLDCPFGTRAGEVEAWRRVRRRALGRTAVT